MRLVRCDDDERCVFLAAKEFSQRDGVSDVPAIYPLRSTPKRASTLRRAPVDDVVADIEEAPRARLGRTRRSHRANAIFSLRATLRSIDS